MSEPINYAREWRDRTGLPDSEQNLRAIKAAVINAIPEYLLFCFCEKQRKAQATFWEPMKGDKAMIAYLIKTHHWHPDQASSLSIEQKLLVLHEELRLLEQEDVYAPVRRDLDFLRGKGIEI